MWFWYPDPDRTEIANYAIFHRRVAEDAKEKMFFFLMIRYKTQRTGRAERKSYRLKLL